MTHRQLHTKLLAAMAAVGLMAGAVHAAALDGASDYGTDAHGWYYTISGGQFPTGNTPNGDNGSGGTFRFLVDNAADWSRDPAQSGNWQKDDWFSDNAGIALTLLDDQNTIVYDNNGIENLFADPDYYDYYAGNYPTGGHGAHVAYSMSNNFDWIYAGYFKIEAPVEVTTLIGYFAYSSNPNDGLTAGFDPNDPAVRYRMNVWSNTAGDLLPTDTNSFTGDVFSSDSTAGTFAFSDTGYDRVGSTSTQDIYRLTYTLAAPITLQPGEYWFSHDAVIPEPTSLALAGAAAIAALALGRRRLA